PEPRTSEWRAGARRPQRYLQPRLRAPRDGHGTATPGADGRAPGDEQPAPGPASHDARRVAAGAGPGARRGPDRPLRERPRIRRGAGAGTEVRRRPPADAPASTGAAWR